MFEISIVVIGAGQRGLSTLERISALYPEFEDAPRLRIHVIDPGKLGQGVHSGTQPLHLITNTTTVQTTVFVDGSVAEAGPVRPGPTYADWLWLSGYRWRDGIVQGEGEPIPGDTYTPRALLGRYLEWCFDHICSCLPEGIVVQEHRTEAVGISKNGQGFIVDLRSEPPIQADYVFVTTGHASGGLSSADALELDKIDKLKPRNARLGFVPSATAFHLLEAVPSDAKVLICGTGLTAADALAILTTARGGRFEAAGHRRVRYVPSGREPRLTLYSRQGLPAGAKGVNQKTIGNNYNATCFTEEFVDAKRRESGSLNWERDLLPCLLREIELCYAATITREANSAASPADASEIHRLVNALIHPWDGETIRSPREHRDFVLNYLADDIDAAFCGNRRDPVKAVSEMLRDLNDVVRHAVDYAGLDEWSHRTFLTEWVSINNRVAAGPPKERNMELLAMMEAGVVDIFEPDPKIVFNEETGYYSASTSRFGYFHEEWFDVLVRARVATFELERSPSVFFAKGRENGIFAPFRNGSFLPGGIAIDRRLNVLDAEGRPSETMWAMGYVVEGAHYYTYVLPCPFSNSRSLRDAATAARGMLIHASSRAVALSRAAADQ